MTDQIYTALSTPVMQELMNMVVNHGYLPLDQQENFMYFRRLHSEHFQVPEFDLGCGSCKMDASVRLYNEYKKEHELRMVTSIKTEIIVTETTMEIPRSKRKK